MLALATLPFADSSDKPMLHVDREDSRIRFALVNDAERLLAFSFDVPHDLWRCSVASCDLSLLLVCGIGTDEAVVRNGLEVLVAIKPCLDCVGFELIGSNNRDAAEAWEVLHGTVPDKHRRISAASPYTLFLFICRVFDIISPGTHGGVPGRGKCATALARADRRLARKDVAMNVSDAAKHQLGW